LIAEELSPATVSALGPDFEIKNIDGTDRAALLSAIATASAGLRSAHGTAQATKTPLINAPTEVLNQGSCWRRMVDSHYRPSIRINAGVMVCQITFYAISLRHW
jgi:hypothetical protein